MPDKVVALDLVRREDEPRPVMLAIAGDSAAGKTTISQGLVAALGPGRSTSVCVDDYYRFERREPRARPFTALHPASNYVRIMEQQLYLLALGLPILKPVYDHADGTLGRPELIEPAEFLIVEGLLPLYTRRARACFHVSVYLDPPETLRHRWKIRRDTAKRGYTDEQVSDELERRGRKSTAFVRHQRAYADTIIRFFPPQGARRGEGEVLNATLVLRRPLAHLELSLLAHQHDDAMRLEVGRDEEHRPVELLHIDAHARREVTEHVTEIICGELGQPGARPSALGVIDKARSESLALTQLVLLARLLQARRSASP